MAGHKSWARVLVRGAVLGASFGLASSTVQVLLLTVGKMRVGVGVPTTSMATAIALETALGLALGACLAPLLRLRTGDHGHLAAVLAAWAGLGVIAGLPELALHLLLLTAPWITAAALVYAGRFLAQHRPRLLPAIGAAAVIATLALPRVSGAAPSVSEARAQPRSGAPDVVLIVADTVRADHLGAWGYDRPTSPTVDRLAREGTMFADATSPATWSLPSHASLFTGRFPSAHGAHAEHRYLSPEHPTLAEALRDAGYETRSFTSNPWISDGLGLTRGFSWSDSAWDDGDMGRSQIHVFRVLDRFGFGATDKGGAEVVAGFERWAADAPRGRPAFAFVNLVEAHFPYHQIPERFLERFSDAERAELRALSQRLLEAQFGGEPPPPESSAAMATDMYDAGVAYTDHLIGRIVRALRERGSLDDTVLVVLADHGELLGEHGAFGHGHSLHEPELRVPLLVRYPARVPAGLRVDTPVSTAAVASTIAELAGLPALAGAQVPSLVPTIERGEPAGPVIAERHAGDAATARAATLERGSPLMRSDVRFRAYRSGSWKLVEASDGSTHLFDLAADPEERHDLARARPSETARLAAELAAHCARLHLPALSSDGVAPAAPPAPIDPDTAERLRALGYAE